MDARVAGLWRYPVKSMLGEALTECAVGPTGLVGDRAFALVDAEDGKVASAKNPRKWGALLACRATYLDDGVVEITLPDGIRVRSDDPAVDDVLSAGLGRPVRLSATAPEASTFEEVWPDIEGLAPEGVITGTTIGRSDEGEAISQLPLAGMAPVGTFFDLAVLHLVTTATLTHLQGLDPSATFDVRRYRPNLLVDTADQTGFVENGWTGSTLQVGAELQVAVTIPTMRCVMTTLPQEDLPQDRATLRAIAASNRIDIPGFFGSWACAGAYGDVAAPGTVAVGDPVRLS